MDEIKCLAFFDVRNGRIRREVGELGEMVSLEDCCDIENVARMLGLDYEITFPCYEGSDVAKKLGEDDSYVVREFCIF